MGVKMGSKKADETIQSAALDVLSQTEWMTVTEVSKEMGCGYSKALNAEMLAYLSQPRTTKEVADAFALSVPRVTFILREWFDLGKLDREAVRMKKKGRYYLWRRKEGGE